MASLVQGRIVWAWMLDEHGRNRKRRTGIIITRSEEIKDGSEFVVVAVTSTFSEPLGPMLVRLPWHRDRNCVATKLTKPVVAKCDWLVSLKAQDIEDYAGVVPSRILVEILKRVATAKDNARRVSDSPSLESD